jgi:hypothetical protein
MSPNQHDIDQQADAEHNGQLKTPVEARQAVKTHHVRWMLVVSLALGVVALGGAYAWYGSLHTPASATTAAVDHPSNG